MFIVYKLMFIVILYNYMVSYILLFVLHDLPFENYGLIQYIKGRVLPKKRKFCYHLFILMLFILITNPHDFLSYAEHKRRYLEKCLCVHIMEVGQNSLVDNILQNIFFCVLQRNESYTGLEQHEGE